MSFSTTHPAQIKVIHVVTVPRTLGFFRGQFKYFQSHGYDVSIVASPGVEFDLMLRELAVKGYGVPMEREISLRADLASLFRLWRLFRRECPDIVHGHTPKGGFLSMLAAWLSRVPVRVYHIHGLRFETTRGLKRTVLMLAEMISCLLAHRVLAVSHSVAEEAIRHGICASKKVKVLGSGSINGVDAEARFNRSNLDPSTRDRMRHRYGVPTDAFVVGFVGRLTRDKGIVELVDAWRIVSERIPRVHLVVVGEFESGDPVPPEVREVLRAENRIHLTGRVQNMPEIYSMFDLVVLPSHREGLGQVLLEAAAMELPAVATCATGCVDAVVDGETGLLVPVGDSKALANAILRYIENPDLRRRHGRAGRERVLRYFKPEDVWSALLAEYRALISTRLSRNDPSTDVVDRELQA